MYRRLANGSQTVREKSLTLDNINQNVRDMEYAVRGEVPIRANEIQRKLKSDPGSWPFQEITKANIGNPHEMGQRPITFVRQVLACCVDPALLEEPFYPDDVKERARSYLQDIDGGSIGAYSHSLGLPKIRRDIAEFISARDGCPSSPDNVILVNGASDGIIGIMNLVVDPAAQGADRAGIMIPIPQYPLYTATISRLGAHQIPYHLDRDNHWCLDINQMRKSLKSARETCTPKLLAVLNPGNPTGQCLPEANMREIIQFCKEESLLLLADEVYQENVYDKNCQFHSFKKVLRSMGKDYQDVELVSCHSISKGYLGECGMRGGYLEIVGVDSTVKEVLEKYFSAKLCSATPGQILTGLMVKPPKEGDPSYKQFMSEKRAILDALHYKAHKVTEKMAEIPGYQCNPVQGAMYAYPMVTVPEGAKRAAKDSGMKVDVFYCMKLLEETGITFVPGSGFGTDINGTFHFRMTILPARDKLNSMIEKLKDFHLRFCEKYSS
jgi:alanine transaminase